MRNAPLGLIDGDRDKLEAIPQLRGAETFGDADIAAAALQPRRPLPHRHRRDSHTRTHTRLAGRRARWSRAYCL